MIAACRPAPSAGASRSAAAVRLAQPIPGSRAAEAVRLAQRFVYADTAGDLDLLDSIYAPKEDMTYCETGFDSYDVISSVSIDPPLARGDTIIVPLVYDVLGYARSDPGVGHFSAAHSIERDSLVGGPDLTGRFRFSCWLQVVPNHMTAHRMSAKWVPDLDSTSRAAWNAVNKHPPN